MLSLTRNQQVGYTQLKDWPGLIHTLHNEICLAVEDAPQSSTLPVTSANDMGRTVDLIIQTYERLGQATKRAHLSNVMENLVAVAFFFSYIKMVCPQNKFNKGKF